MTRRTADARVFRKATEAKRQARGAEFAEHVVTSRLLPEGCRDLEMLTEFYELRRGYDTRRQELPERDLSDYDLERWLRLVESEDQSSYVRNDWITPLRSTPRSE